jgi:hypothetical protein
VPPAIHLHLRRLLAASVFLTWAATQLSAQSGITSITTALTTESGGTYQTGTVTSGSSSATFAATNNDLEVSSFQDAAGNIFDYSASSTANATASVVRRNTATSGSGSDTDANENGFSVWYASGSSSTSLNGAYNTSANNVLLGNNLYVGSDNLFVNNNGSTTPNQSNVERVDFEFGTTGTTDGQTTSAGISASTTLALAVFDRGVVDAHDAFNIALIMGYDANGNPIYTDSGVSGLKALSETSTSYGTVNPVATFNYTLFRYDSGQGNNLDDNWNADSETASQGAGGVVFTLSDFGITNAEIASGLTIYGYSVMGADDTTTLANLGGTNYQNSTDYPTTTTDGSPDDGGVDLLAVNGNAFVLTAAPEPALYGAVFAALMLGWYVLWRRSVTAKAA